MIIVQQRTEYLLFILISSLICGTLVYVFFRTPSDLYFLGNIRFPWKPLLTPRWAFWLDSFPTFCHALTFSLATILLLPRSVRSIWFGCLFWALIHFVFEAGQLLKSCPIWLANISLANTPILCIYFTNGTFDLLDIASACAGCLFAYLIAKRSYFH